MLNKWQKRIPARVTSKPVLTLYFATTIFTGFLAQTPVNREISVNWHLLDLVKAFSIAILIYVFRSAVSKNKFLLFGICIAGNLIQNLFAYFAANGKLPSFMYEGILVGPLSDIAVILAIALFIEAVSSTRSANKEIRHNRNLLKNIGTSLKSQLADEEKRLNRQVSEVVRNVVGEIDQQLTKVQSGALGTESVTAAMQSNINKVIRPLSHRLEFDQEVLELQDAKSKVIRFNPFTFLSHKVSLGSTFNPELIMLILIGTILGTYFFLLGLSGFFTLGIPTMALTYLLLAFMHRFVKKIEVRVFWAFLFSFLITVLTYLLFTFTHSLAKGKFEADSLIVIANGALISALAVGIGNIFYAYASKALADGQVLNQELLSVVNSARNNLWAYQKTIARVLHGNVQARLQAATLKLAKSENSEEVLTEIRKDLSGAIGAVQSPLGNSNKSLSESLIELIDLWSYACRIEVDIPDSIYARFADKSFATECALEVINEAITNAVKHGGAESVSIKATEVKQELVEFNIRNPRTKQSAVVGSGLGSKILEEATQAFIIKESESEYLLTASIFVGN